jgi:hypothetical protein
VDLRSSPETRKGKLLVFTLKREDISSWSHM